MDGRKGKRSNSYNCNSGDKKKPRADYHYKNEYVLKHFAGVTKIVTKSDSRVLATKESATFIIKDIHVSVNQLGERKIHKKIIENHSNVPRSL